MFLLYISVILILEFCKSYEGFKISNFHDVCGDTINDDAGELKFDAQELPSYLSGSKCSVTVQPQSEVLTEKTRVLFYFTKFYLTGWCGDMNVKIEEGHHGHVYNRTLVEGLPYYICGHNTSLEQDDQIFTTRTDRLIVTFNRGYFAKHSAGIFSMKFIAFQIGDCTGSGVSNCSNGRCVASEYFCSNEINACGERQLECFLDILELIKNYWWIVAVLIGLCALKPCYKNNKECICDLKASACSGLRKLFSDCCQLRRQTYTSSRRQTRRRSPDDSFQFWPNFSTQHERTRVVLDASLDDRFQLRSNVSTSRERIPAVFDASSDDRVQLRPNFPTVCESTREILDASNDYNPSPPIAQPEGISLNEDKFTPSVMQQDILLPSAPYLQSSPYLPSAPPPPYDDVCAPSYEDVVANKDKI